MENASSKPIKPQDAFELVAMHTTNFYASLVRKYKEKFRDEASLLAAAGIIDAGNYVFAEKSIPAHKIAHAAAEAVKTKSPLLRLIIVLEKLIYEVDQPVMDKKLFGEQKFSIYDIHRAVEDKKEDISKIIDSWLEFNKTIEIVEPVVECMMNDEEVQKIFRKLNLLKD